MRALVYSAAAKKFLPRDLAPGKILLAESFRMIRGATPPLAMHRKRFTDGLATLNRPDLDVDPGLVWAHTIRELSALPNSDTDLFPRLALEMHEDKAVYVLRIRPAQPLREITRIEIPQEVDPRGLPQVKGPDIAVLAELVHRTQQSQPAQEDQHQHVPQGQPRLQRIDQHIDDVVLHDGEHVFEATTGALVLVTEDSLILPEAPLNSTSVHALIGWVNSRRIPRVDVIRRPVTLTEFQHWNTGMVFMNAHRGPSTAVLGAQTPQPHPLHTQLRELWLGGFSAL